MKIALAEALARLPLPATDRSPQGVWDMEVFRHGSLTLGLYAPKVSDYQSTHELDEIYLVAGGSGILVSGTDRESAAAGDVLFVPAGTNHHFEGFSDDFVVWVILWGPRGGASAQEAS